MHAMLHQVCGRVHKRERARSQSGDVNHRAENIRRPVRCLLAERFLR